MRLTGGCQCGAVRFAVSSGLGRGGICHCRMCQKAFAAPFGALISVENAGLEWTRGAPAHFKSSNQATRGFCVNCGTPLTYEAKPGFTEVAICAFDDPDLVPPTVQFSLHTHVAWLTGIGALAEKDLSIAPQDLVSYQHPDHDTDGEAR